MRHGKKLIRFSGFTLIEMMIVVAIIGVLGSTAVASYQDSMIKTRRAEGKSFLNQIMQQEEKYYTENMTYTNKLKDLGFSSNAPKSENKHYQVRVLRCSRTAGAPAGAVPWTECVRLEARPFSTAQKKDTRCNRLRLDSRGKKSETGTSTVNECW